MVISRDFGKIVEIAKGLASEDRVIETPPDGITAGDLVRIAAGKAAIEREVPTK